MEEKSEVNAKDLVKNPLFRGKMEEINVDDYEAFGLNWKKHPSNQLNLFRKLMKEVGFVSTVLVNKRTHHILDGHMRMGELKKRGIKKVPAVVLDVDEAMEAKIVTTFDLLGKKSSKKKSTFLELVKSINFDDKELAREFEDLIKMEELELKEDAAPPIDKNYSYVVLVFKEKYNFLQALAEFGIEKKMYIEGANSSLKVKIADGDKWSEKIS